MPSRGSRSCNSAVIILIFAAVVEVVGRVATVAGTEVRIDWSGGDSDVAEHG